MENFRRQFTLEAVETLRNLLTDLQSAEEFSDSKKREAFRTLHTIKGTAQTFGFTASSRLAHELETVLSAKRENENLFLEGINLLIKSLTETDFMIPRKFAEQMRAALPGAAETASEANYFSSAIPAEIYSQLTKREKDALHSATAEAKNLYGLEINFAPASFADELINFRESLSASGEIIATFPSAKSGADGVIGFLVLYASSEKFESSRAEILFEFSPADFPENINGVLALAVKHGEAIAKKYNKQIRFTVSAAETNLAPRKLKLVFDILLHLVRNAVDHAIESEGEIKIKFRGEKNGLRLTVADDGCGVDLEKLKAKAIEKNLLAAHETLTERETIDLIFLPEVSTAATVTDISGRGIGLDAVKNAVEKASGKISVASRNDCGTTFEIFLPNEN